MNNFSLTPDLRYPGVENSDPADQWSQWSSLAMMELSALEIFHFGQAMIAQPAQRIVEGGCGNGYLTLGSSVCKALRNWA